MQIIHFETKNQLIKALLETCSKIIVGNNQAKNKTNFCLEGGSTPFEFYAQLADSNLDFGSTKLWQTDERYIPATHADSNQKKLRETFEPSKNLTLELFDTNLNYSLCAQEYGQRLQGLLKSQQFDLTILGFGTDGHFASIFGGKDSEDQLNSTELTIYSTASDIYPVSQRLSLTPRALTQSQKIIVILTGNDKKAVLQEFESGKLSTAHYPCKYWLDNKSVEIWCWW